MKEVLEKYKSFEEKNLNSLKNQLIEIQNQISSIEDEITQMKNIINSFNYNSVSYGIDLNFATNYIQYLNKEIISLNTKLKKLYKKEEEIKSQISLLNGKIKAVEKYLEKLNKEEYRKTLKNEGLLIDEVFNRKFNNT